MVYPTKEQALLLERQLMGSTEQLVSTKFGMVNITVGGKRDAPSLVFWPSLMLAGDMWSYQYEHFAPDYNVVLIDSPGIGKSDGLRRAIALEDSAEIVIDILDALKIQKCLFLGNSWGGMLAGVMPAWYPERLYGAVAINATASVPTTPESIQMSLLANLIFLNAKVPGWWVRVATGAFAGDTAEAERPEFMSFLNCVSQQDPKSISWAMKGILLGRTDRHRLLSTINNTPVMVIAGEEDRQFPVHIVRRMAEAIKGSKFVILQKTAHLAARENPELVSSEIDAFIKERRLFDEVESNASATASRVAA